MYCVMSVISFLLLTQHDSVFSRLVERIMVFPLFLVFLLMLVGGGRVEATLCGMTKDNIGWTNPVNNVCECSGSTLLNCTYVLPSFDQYLL